VIQLCGPDPADRRAVAAAAAAAVGLQIAAIPADLIPVSAGELEALVRLWEREAALGGTVLLVECDDADRAADQPRARRVNRLAEGVAGLVIISDRERRPLVHRPAISLDVHRPTLAEQRTAWRAALEPISDRGLAGIDSIPDQFSLGLPMIRSAAAAAV